MTTMNKYLIIKFSNARLFRKIGKNGHNYNCKDYVRTGYGKGYISRDELPSFIEPLTVYQIANSLCVLWGERPVPSLRNCYYPRNEYFFEKAQNSYLRIDTPKMENGGYYTEFMQTKKAVWNSWEKNVCINWEVIKNYIDDKKKFDVFVKKLNEVLNSDSQLQSFYDIRKSVMNLDQEKRLELYDVINKLGDISGLIYFFGRFVDGKFVANDDGKLTAKLNRTARTVNSGVEKYASLSGQIIVPVSEEDIINLRKSKGFARILDGGLVLIDSIKDENQVSIEGFTLVKDISIEKSIPAINK
jgi:hypothetical protein